MKWSLDFGIIEVDVCITFEETQVLEVLGGKDFCFGMNSMMPYFDQIMMGEESVPEVTSCKEIIDGVSCDCNV